MTNKNRTRNTLGGFNGMVCIRGTRFFHRLKSKTINNNRLLYNAFSPLNISVISRNATNLLLRRKKGVQQTSITRHHGTFRNIQLQRVRVSVISRLLRHEKMTFRKMTTNMNAMIPRRLLRHNLRILRHIRHLSTTNMTKKGFVRVGKIRHILLGNLTRRNIRGGRLTLFPMGHPSRPIARQGTTRLISTRSHNVLVTPNRDLRRLIFSLVTLLSRNGKSIPLGNKFNRMTSVQLRRRKRGLLRFLYTRFLLPRRGERRNMSNNNGIVTKGDISTIMMFLGDFIPNFARVFLHPPTKVLTTKTVHPQTSRRRNILFIQRTRRNGLRLGNTLNSRRHLLQNILRRNVTRLLPIGLQIRHLTRAMVRVFRPNGKQNRPTNKSVMGDDGFTRRLWKVCIRKSTPFPYNSSCEFDVRPFFARGGRPIKRVFYTPTRYLLYTARMGSGRKGVT